MDEKFPPKWVSRIERRLFWIANNWIPVFVTLIFVLCFIGALTAPVASE
jgi:hypothetical protein